MPALLPRLAPHIAALLSILLSTPLFAASYDVAVKSGEVSLAGTLMAPPGQGPFPGVVLLPGSGPSTRADVQMMAEQLVSRGWAVLVYDKRGCGASTGSWLTSSLSELADDAVAALSTLAGRGEVDKRRVGLWGVSQSGWVGPIAAGRTSAAKFLVAVAGGGATPMQVEMFGYEHALDRAGLTKDEIATAHNALNAYFEYLKSGRGLGELKATLAAPANRGWAAAVGLARVLPDEEARHAWEWVATYDPVPDIQRLKIPTLVMLGGLDEDSPLDEAFAGWSMGLSATGDPRSRVLVVPAAGHGMTVGGHHVHPSAENTRYAPGLFDEAIRWERMVTASA